MMYRIIDFLSDNYAFSLWLINLIFFWTFSLVFLIVERKIKFSSSKIFVRLKINKFIIKQFSLLKILFEGRTDIFSNILFNQFITLPLLYILFDRILKLHERLSYDELPGFRIILLKLILVYISQDFIYYFFHRLIHKKFIYSIHKVHHKFKKPFSILAFYTHPLELFGNNVIFLGISYFFN